MSDQIKAAIRTTALIAYNHADALTETQLRAVLMTLIEYGTDHEAKLADQHLFHLTEARKAQLILSAEINGVGNPKP